MGIRGRERNRYHDTAESVSIKSSDCVAVQFHRRLKHFD